MALFHLQNCIKILAIERIKTDLFPIQVIKMDQILLTGYKVWAVSEARPKYSSFHVKVSFKRKKGKS